MDRIEFKATIYKSGINPYVDVPLKAEKQLDRRGYVPVTGTLGGTPIDSTLVPLGGGRHRLFINTEMRKAAKVGEGDRVRIELRVDDKPRRLPMPAQLERALEADDNARMAWERMTPSHRKEWLAYLNSLKRPDTIEKNVAKMIGILLERR